MIIKLSNLANYCIYLFVNLFWTLVCHAFGHGARSNFEGFTTYIIRHTYSIKFCTSWRLARGCLKKAWLKVFGLPWTCFRPLYWHACMLARMHMAGKICQKLGDTTMQLSSENSGHSKEPVSWDFCWYWIYSFMAKNQTVQVVFLNIQKLNIFLPSISFICTFWKDDWAPLVLFPDRGK